MSFPWSVFCSGSRYKHSLFALLLSLTPTWAFGFPVSRHYSVATEAAELAPDSLDHWDSESSSDWLTYQRPLAREALWYRSLKTFDLSLGSISSKQFLTYRHLKLEQPLLERLKFRLQWLEERDFEVDRASVPIELEFALAKQWAVSVFGMPSLYKAEDDAGLSLYHRPTPEWEFQGSVVWGDLQRNQRNLESDSWSEHPVSWTLSALYLDPKEMKDFARLEMHDEPRSRRERDGAPITDLSYRSLQFSGHRGDWGGRLLYDHAFVSQPNDEGVRDRRRALQQVEYQFIMGPHVMHPALNFFYREMRQGNELVVTREWLPAIWMDMPTRYREWGRRTISVGYDATVFQRQGVDGGRDENLEHRLNLKLDLGFKQAGELALLATFDLDRFGSGETWEGGAGQFRVDF